MADDDLKLNSLQRFTKHGSRLLLEEHGHCEVPAGCGGVVLRWRNPHEVPVALRVYGAVEVAAFIDDEPADAWQRCLQRGAHLLALRVGRDDQAEGLRVALMAMDGPQFERARTALVASTADGSWRGCAEGPADDSWRGPTFDDSRFAPLAEVSRGPLGERGAWLDGLGARALELNAPTVWIRKWFELR